MKAGSFRKQRVAEVIASTLAKALGRSPNGVLSAVTITSVEVQKDLRRATVYWSSLLAFSEQNDSEVRGVLGTSVRLATQRALEAERGELRHEIGSALRIRHTPELEFRYDESIASGARIDALLAESTMRTENGESEPHDEEP